MKCPACNRTKSSREIEPGIYQCKKCQAVFGTCYLGDSYKHVLPHFVNEEIPADRRRYFNFRCIGSRGVTRRHGWYDPETKRIVQVR